MIEYLNSLFTQITPAAAYVLLTVSAFVENTFPPIPGDTVTVIGAYLVSSGKLDFWGVYFSTTAGSTAGFFAMYLLGLKYGRSFLRTKMGKRLFNEARVHKVEIWFSHYGLWVIAANRFLSGTRSVVSIFAGLFHLKWPIVLLLSTVSAFIWNGLLIYGGYQLGVNWTVLTGIISEYNKVVLALTVIVIGFIIYKKLRKRSQRKENVEP